MVLLPWVMELVELLCCNCTAAALVPTYSLFLHFTLPAVSPRVEVQRKCFMIGGSKKKEECWNALIGTLIGTRVAPPLT